MLVPIIKYLNSCAESSQNRILSASGSPAENTPLPLIENIDPMDESIVIPPPELATHDISPPVVDDKTYPLEVGYANGNS